MFYTFILQVVVLLIIVTVISTSNVGNQKQLEMNYYKITMVYKKEQMIKEAIERYILDYGSIPSPLTVQELIDKNELSDNFVNNNGIEGGTSFDYEIVNNNYVRISHNITDSTKKNIYLKHYKGSSYGIKPYELAGKLYHEYQLENKVVDVLKGRVNNGEGYIPIGAVMSFSVDYATSSKCPIGWLLADGGVVGASYPILQSMLPTLPDLRGEFLRGLDDGRGVDVGRVIGSYQSNDQKSFTVKSESALTDNTGPVYMDKYTSEHNNNEFYTGKWESPGTKINIWWDNSEVRPRNISVRYCIKHDYN